MRYNVIPRHLFASNRQRLSGLLDKNSLAIICANNQKTRNGDQFFPFRQNSDLFYLSGIEQEQSVLIIFPGSHDKKQKEVLFLRKPDQRMETWEGKKLTKEEARGISGIDNVQWMDHFDEISHEMILKSESICLNTTEQVKFQPDLSSRDHILHASLKAKYPSHNFRRLAPLLRELRLLKNPEEVELISQACRITGKAFRLVLKNLKPDMMEFQVEAEIIREFISSGSSGHAYAPIIASGVNACYLHYIRNDAPCKDGDLLLMDFGAEYANYAADCTRTIPVNGRFSARQRDLYNSVLELFYFARSLMRPGTSIEKLHEKVCRKAEEEHIRLGLYSKEELSSQDPGNPLFMKYFMHGTSHFIGLDVHDVGDRQTILKPGMVLSCEPAIYLPEERTGIRLENDILITEEDPLDLMESIPIRPEEIENYMEGISSE